MLAELFAVLAPVLIAAGIGYGWTRSGHAYPTDFVARLVLNIGTPCLVLSTLSRAELDLGAFSQMALACVLVTCAMGAIGWLLSRLFAIDWKVLVPAYLFPIMLGVAGWSLYQERTSQAWASDWLQAMRKVPRGAASSVRLTLCMASAMASISRHWPSNCSPAPVRLSLRVVRCSRRAPTQVSSSPR